MGKKKTPLVAEPPLVLSYGAQLSTPRAVLDTNCLVSSLIFKNGALSWIRHSWEVREFIPLVSAQTVDELIRVLAYPKFALSAEECQNLLEDFLPFAETVQIRTRRSGEYLKARTELTDPDDQPFLDLAFSTQTDALVSGDKALLRLAGDVKAFQILNPKDFRPWLDERL